MDGYNNRHLDIQNWEIISIGDEYYRLLRASGHPQSDAELTDTDLDQLLDVYHYWKILLGCRYPRYADMAFVLHVLHFDVIIELFCQHKLHMKQKLTWIFD